MKPKDFIEAMSDPTWHNVMNKEMASIETNETWTLVDLLTRCSQMLMKWLFQIKHELEGTLIKYKACLVAHGFEQQEGIYYLEVFTSVAGWTDYPYYHCGGYST